MSHKLDDADCQFLRYSIEISRYALDDEGKTPFGALVVIDDKVVGEGISRVVELHDPTAHAEIMALRQAGSRLGRHLFEDATMYSSSEPCPMCLVAVYWARIPRIVFAAKSRDVARFGFEDLQFYRELTYSADNRVIREDPAGGDLRDEAVAILRRWVRQLTIPVEPKF